MEDVDRLDMADILKNVERSLERVFVLHCEDRYAQAVLQKAWEVCKDMRCTINMVYINNR